MNPTRWLSALLLVAAVVVSAMWWLQRQAAEALRAEIALLHEDNRELARLRGENQRLAAAQPPSAEMARLREDHAAVVRLRGEIEAVRRRAAEPANRSESPREQK